MTISAILNDYRAQLPMQIPRKAAQGFVATVVLQLAVGSTLPLACVGGMIAVTATLVEALARPIIRALFDENPFIVQCMQVTISSGAAFACMHTFAPKFAASYKAVSFWLSFLAWIPLNQDFIGRNVAMAEVL
jgi:hypothetical protein